MEINLLKRLSRIFIKYTKDIEIGNEEKPVTFKMDFINNSYQ